uniref:Ig-like domain-containing protein n=1 Tax=Cyprinus carpio TaxID=7962 RepID=A0A8C1S587_CYPCA
MHCNIRCCSGNAYWRHTSGNWRHATTKLLEVLTGRCLVIREVDKRPENMVYPFVLFSLCLWSMVGVFGVDGVKSVSVMEGDSVTLNTDDTHIQKDDQIMWKFGQNNSLIAHINRKINKSTVHNDSADGRFRDILKLDNQTGSLIITNIRTTHSGLYKVFSKTETPLNIFNLTVYACLPVPIISRDCASSSPSSSSSQQNSFIHQTLSWYKGNSLLSSISVSDLSISLSLPLGVEYQDNNTYSCVINNPIRNQTTHLDITQLCQTYPEHGLTMLISSAAAAVGFLLIVVAVMIFSTCRKNKKVNQEDAPCPEEILYSETTFNKRKAQKSRDKDETEVVYAGITVRC